MTLTPNRLRTTGIALAAAAAFTLAGCESMSERQRGTATGAGVGAGIGAILGKTTGSGDNAGRGAVIGGAIGAIAGNVWSKRMEDKHRAMEQATRGTGIDVAKTDDNQLKVNVPSDFSFDVGRAAIRPEMRPVLDQFAQGLDPNMRVRIIGHTDSTGSDAINNPLSIERAQSVRDYLAARGVSPSRVEVSGQGSRQPVAGNESADGRARNRRVEIFLREPEQRAG